ncbi:MAG: hypothetical protein A2Y62_09395 [Candidatus Fischerbacteria bacterium RBG_13_37_8]|uniref:AttH domain-containing protein n=1 Tax=Candidatus Fischerbacteria bacterium RBG_13_37_8 TaxID=1817863 RepID=A0A1F5VXE4_9BACT|nr:MAG: hypothetical protein A2Y62_09395 [Candidatus Fischerbacteria bacterium RBG_13_37_8]
MKKTINKIVLISIGIIIASVSFAQDQEEAIASMKIPWDSYVEWWYFNGALLLQDDVQQVSFPFILILGHESRVMTAGNPPRQLLMTILIDYHDEPGMISDSHTNMNPGDGINKYLNPDLKNFYYSLPEERIIVQREKEDFIINVKNKSEVALYLRVKLLHPVEAQSCAGLLKLDEQLPLLAYDYPVVEYSGEVTLKGKKFNVAKGSGYIDYNAWRVQWTKTVKEWFWFSALTDDYQATFFGIRTAEHDFIEYDIRSLTLLDRKNSAIKEYCGDQINVHVKENKSEDSAVITLTTNDVSLILEAERDWSYLLNRPEYINDMHFTEIKMTYDNKNYFGFAFIEFLDSIMAQ